MAYRSWRALGALVCIGAAGATGAACAAGGDVDAKTSGTTSGTASGAAGGEGGSGGAGASAASGGAGNEGIGGIGAQGGAGNQGQGGACAESKSTATTELVPVDLIIAVDTSGSMAEGFPEGIGPSEISQVNSNLNNAATIITASGIDMHVVMIADSAVCIGGSIGSGSCPNDENLPAYRHVQQKVDSEVAFQRILDTYPSYAPSLRPNALKRILVVTDDNDDMAAQTFIAQLTALDSTFAAATIDSIVAFEGPVDSCINGCGLANHPCCPCFPFDPITWPLSAAGGANYLQASTLTGGVAGDLCLQQFGPFFASIGNAIVEETPISCELDIPAPPMGETLDFGKVNVEYVPGMGQPDDVLNVPNAGSCGISGWYYDDAQSPTKIVLCPGTCAAVQNDPDGEINVLFGCETQSVPS